MKKPLSHADKFVAQMPRENIAQERRQLISAYGNDKESLQKHLNELKGGDK